MKQIIFAFLILGIVILLGRSAGELNLGQNLSRVSRLSPTRPATKPIIAQTETPQQVSCSGKVLPALTEGPYYKDGSPRRRTIRTTRTPGTKFSLSGYVLDTNCKPVANAWIDFWQADANGNYDNTGYNLRGYQYTDRKGKYSLETIIPGEYTGRTRHIHAKVRTRQNGPVLTTQLFFEGASRNETDAIFSKDLLMKVTDSRNGKVGTFNFIVNTDL